MSALADLAARLTLPYGRGAEYLALPLGADGGGATAIGPYGFAAYEARWDEPPPAPAYVIAPRFDVQGDDLQLTIAYDWGGPGTIGLVIPRGTPAAAGFAIPLPAGADARLRLTALRVEPALPGPGRDQWDIVALLGTLARLVWLLGAEKEQLARTRAAVRAQRCVDTAFGAGLDALGADMRVPRFPPRPYGYDGQTIGLWHLDDVVADGGTVLDATTRPGNAGHPGIVAGALANAPGKYGRGFAFTGNGSGSAIVVAASADFDIAAGADMTIEAFARAAVPADTTPRALVAHRAAQPPGPSSAPGWALCIANARGFDANPMLALCDGVREVVVFADLSIADGAFHHVAAIVDRAHGRARLLVDGVQRATAAIDALGAVATPADLRFGATAAGNGFTGTLDEVRISSVARKDFHPVLGESDDAYRERLRIFRRWVLPTPQQVIALVNQAAPLGGDPAPYVLVEANRLTQTAEYPVRIVPATLPAGAAIALDGSAAADETVAGTPADDDGFDPALDLLAYANPAVDTNPVPGGARMQAGTALALDALVARLAGVPGRLVVAQAFDGAGPTPLHAVGRALRLRHETLATPQLGALAHAAGFAYVRNLGPDVAVAVPAGERLLVRATPAPVAGRVDAGQAFDLAVDPPLPPSGVFSWTIVTPGPVRAHLAAHSADSPLLKTPIAARPRVRLVTEAAGNLAVRVEYTTRGQRRSGTLALRVDPVTLADGHALDAVGNPDPDLAAIVAAPDPGFTPDFLATHAPGAAIDFGASPDNRRMQVTALDALDALAALLAARGVAGRLQVLQAFVAGGAGVEAVGRRLVLGHETLDAGMLGALAARSFDYVQRAGSTVLAYVRPGPWLAVRDASGAPAPAEIPSGVAQSLAIAPGPLPAGSYNWSLRRGFPGAGTLDSSVHPGVQFTPTRAGPAVLALTYVAADDTRAAPYTFEVRLKPALDTPATIIPKPQYDIIMNVLDTFHPVGVEVRTTQLRKHVPEIEQDPTRAFPAYSFPDFHL